MDSTDTTSTPTAFISYSHDSEEHKDWVLKLATNLRWHGVDVCLDQWNLELGNDLPFFMEHGLSNSSFVICVCSKQYVDKANNNTGGVGYEKRIISGKLLTDFNSIKIIPIVKNNPEKDKLPTCLGEMFYSDFDNGQYVLPYGKVLEHIYNRNFTKIPPLGKNPFEHTISVSAQVLINDKLQQTEYHSPGKEGLVSFDYSNNNGIYTIGNGDYAFDTKWSGASKISIHCYKDGFNINKVGVNHQYKEFPDDIDSLISFDYSSRSRIVKIGEVVVWMNMSGMFAITKVLSIKHRNRGDDVNEVCFCYKIYGLDL